MASKIYFISGVNGVGKSTLIPHLHSLLPADKYMVHDFDMRGVPDGADNAWRKAEAEHWIEEGMRVLKEGKTLVICGFVKASDFEQNPPLEVKVIVLHADAETIRARLMKRYTKDGVFDEEQKVIGKPVQEFIAGNVWYADKMYEESKTEGLPVIDTSTLSPEEVAEQVSELIQKGS